VPDLFVIIVNWNTAQLLKDCLQSIRESIHGITCKICVVDNGSTDGSVEIIKTEFPEVLLIKNKTNRGFAAASNQGIRASTGHYVLMLNSDTLISAGVLGAIVAWADEHTDVGVLGPRLVYPDGSIQSSGLSFPSLLRSFVANIHLARLLLPETLVKRLLKKGWDSDSLCEVDYVSGACMLVRREALEQVGLLDEDFFMYGEEIEWCYRMKKAGWRVMYHPQIKVVHLHNRSGAQKWGLRGMAARKLGERLFYRKSYGRLAATVFSTVYAILSLIRFSGYCVLSLSPLASSDQSCLRRKYAEMYKWSFLGLIGMYDQRRLALRAD
jgi:GT2 family glycosyltransferase